VSALACASQARRQRQGAEEGALRGAELVVRPLRAKLAAVARRRRRRQRHGVVVAQHQLRALGGQRHGLLHHGGRLAAVAHQVAQQGELLGPMGARVLQAGGEGLPVGVDVGQQGDLHGISPAPIIARVAERRLAAGPRAARPDFKQK